ncbi:hypothetical protein D3C75_1005170 [compost metagenome]
MTLCGRIRVWARRMNRVMPTSMTTMEMTRPQLPGRVMSPKPVVVRVATVKYRASR